MVLGEGSAFEKRQIFKEDRKEQYVSGRDLLEPGQARLCSCKRFMYWDGTGEPSRHEARAVNIAGVRKHRLSR